MSRFKFKSIDIVKKEYVSSFSFNGNKNIVNIQSTGFFDGEGNEIFEDDILVYCPADKDTKNILVFYVFWNASIGSFDVEVINKDIGTTFSEFILFYLNNCVIIGNSLKDDYLIEKYSKFKYK